MHTHIYHDVQKKTWFEKLHLVTLKWTLLVLYTANSSNTNELPWMHTSVKTRFCSSALVSDFHTFCYDFVLFIFFFLVVVLLIYQNSPDCVNRPNISAAELFIWCFFFLCLFLFCFFLLWSLVFYTRGTINDVYVEIKTLKDYVNCASNWSVFFILMLTSGTLLHKKKLC